MHTIVSKKNLELSKWTKRRSCSGVDWEFSIVLAETDMRSVKDVVPPVEETIKNMFCNRRYVLSGYRSLEQKMQLLDAAVETSDGNIILTVRVVIWLENLLEIVLSGGAFFV